MSENLNEPQSRTEEILQNALGEEYDVTPQSRVEKLLEQVVEGGGGSGVSIREIPISLTDGYYGTAKMFAIGPIVCFELLFGHRDSDHQINEEIATFQNAYPLILSEVFLAYKVGSRENYDPKVLRTGVTSTNGIYAFYPDPVNYYHTDGQMWVCTGMFLTRE